MDDCPGLSLMDHPENLSQHCYHSLPPSNINSILNHHHESTDLLSDLTTSSNSADNPMMTTTNPINLPQNQTSGRRGSLAMRRKASVCQSSHSTLHQATHSATSLLSTMENFVQSVEEMNETILVPCRLMDLRNERTGVDLYAAYSVLNSVKNDLVWGNQPSPASSTTTISAPPLQMTTTIPYHTLQQKDVTPPRGHVRTPSTISNISLQSDNTDVSENNSSTGEESGVEDDFGGAVADTFKLHLNGLYKCLTELTETAQDLTQRYNRDLGQDSI